MYDDEIELDYGPMEDEIPEPRNQIRGSSNRKGKANPCPVCPGRFTNVRRHVICNHLPWYVSPTTCCWTCKLQFAQPSLLNHHLEKFHTQADNDNLPHKFEGKILQNKWIDLMNGLLKEITKQLNIETSELVEYVKKVPEFSTCKDSFHHSSDMQLLKEFNNRNHYNNIELIHRVYPPTSVSNILHWRILALLIYRTESAENLIVFEEEVTIHTATKLPDNTVIPFIDSHFHLDRYLRETRRSGLPTFIWKDSESETTILQKLISNYCFPHSWPSSTEREEIRKDDRLRFTYGIHPRLVNLESKRKVDGWLKDLETMIASKRVVAVGECGLDQQDRPNRKELDRQIYVLECHAQLAKGKELPLVIHCRGDQTIDNKCLQVLQKVLDKNHMIHRHCFTGDLHCYKKWKKSFPNCKFGISPFLLMTEQYPDLRSTICNMNIYDIILETDAPYIGQNGRGTGCPSLVIKIAEKLSIMFEKPLQEIASITTRNAELLYHI